MSASYIKKSHVMVQEYLGYNPDAAQGKAILSPVFSNGGPTPMIPKEGPGADHATVRDVSGYRPTKKGK